MGDLDSSSRRWPQNIPLGCADASDHRRPCAQHYGYVEKNVAVIDVKQVVLQPMMYGQRARAANLPKACDAGSHEQSLAFCLAILVNNKAHFGTNGSC